MRPHLILFLALSFFVSIAMADSTKSPTQKVQKIMSYKNQESLFKVFEKNLSEDQFAEFQEIMKEANIHSHQKLKIEITGKNRFEFQSNEFIFSHTGKHLRFNKKNFSIDQKKSLYWNYQNILSKTKGQEAFHILTLLYFVKFKNQG